MSITALASRERNSLEIRHEQARHPYLSTPHRGSQHKSHGLTSFNTNKHRAGAGKFCLTASRQPARVGPSGCPLKLFNNKEWKEMFVSRTVHGLFIHQPSCMSGLDDEGFPFSLWNSFLISGNEQHYRLNSFVRSSSGVVAGYPSNTRTFKRSAGGYSRVRSSVPSRTIRYCSLSRTNMKG
jgi:hypothetical protein